MSRKQIYPEQRKMKQAPQKESSILCLSIDALKLNIKKVEVIITANSEFS